MTFHASLESLFHRWFDDASSHLLLEVISADGDWMNRVAVFLLVAARLTGFVCIGPLLGRSLLPWQVRLGLIVLLTLIVAPGIELKTPETTLVTPVSHELRELVPDDGASASLISDVTSPAGLLVAVLSNLGVGAALGLAVAIFMSGIKLGGEWLDRHSGLGMGSVLNPEYPAGGSAPAELAWLFCVATIVIMQPVNGHLLVVRYVLDTFHAIPVATADLPVSVLELAKAIVQQSLILGLRIAMPFVVAMSLLDMTLGWVRRSSRWELTSTAYALRTGAALLILAATFPGIQESVSSSVFETFKIADDDLLSSITDQTHSY